MKKLLIVLMAVVAMFAFTACGGSGGSKEVKVEEFGLVGSISCRDLKWYGGGIHIKADIEKIDGLELDSFSLVRSVNGENRDVQTPIVLSSKNKISINDDMYVYDSTGDKPVLQVIDLVYLDKGTKRLYRGACEQPKHDSEEVARYVRVVDVPAPTNTSNVGN